jgi:hypothetical protein
MVQASALYGNIYSSEPGLYCALTPSGYRTKTDLALQIQLSDRGNTVWLPYARRNIFLDRDDAVARLGRAQQRTRDSYICEGEYCNNMLDGVNPAIRVPNVSQGFLGPVLKLKATSIKRESRSPVRRPEIVNRPNDTRSARPQSHVATVRPSRACLSRLTEVTLFSQHPQARDSQQLPASRNVPVVPQSRSSRTLTLTDRPVSRILSSMLRTDD